MGSADNSDTEVSEAAHKNLIKDGYRASNKVDYIVQILLLEIYQFHINLRVSSMPKIIEATPL